jgi:hypothetical protein
VIVIGSESFGTKKAATERVRSILYSYRTGETLTPADTLFLAALLSRHPEAELKVGAGIASFQVESNGPTQGFWITRVDGSRTDFSFVACLSPPSHASQVKKAFRYAVTDQVRAFKEAAFAGGGAVACAVTGFALGREQAHVDHSPTFQSLLEWFMAERGISFADVAVNATRDGDTETVLVDDQLASAWSAFHRANAGLRIVSAAANLGLLRRRL